MYVRTWWLTLVLGAAGEACTPVRSAGLLQKAARHRSAGGVRAVNYGLPGCLCVGVDGVKRTKRQEPFIGAHCDNWTGPCKQEPCERWCFVDPCQCNVSSRESAATEQLTWEGRKLHLSEETCHSPPPTRGAKGTSPSDGRFCNAYDEESYGDRKCKCIGVEHLKGQVAVEVAGETATYPADVGSRCAAWDAEPLSLCAREDAPSWCQKSWCYVDPCACAIAEPPKVSTYFPSASYRKRPLYYSYETCGAQDSFTPDSSKACVNQETEARCLSLGADPEDPELRKCAWGGPEIKCLGKELLHMCQVDEETLSHWSWWSFSYGDVGSQQLLGAVVTSAVYVVILCLFIAVLRGFY